MKRLQCAETKNNKSTIDTVITRNWSRANKIDVQLACMHANSFESAWVLLHYGTSPKLKPEHLVTRI